MIKFFILLFFSISLGAKIYNSENQKFVVETVYKGDEVIWGFDFLSKDEIVFTQRSGQLLFLNTNQKKAVIVQNTPSVKHDGQGGLLDVLIRKEGQDTVIYLTYSRAIPAKGSTTSLGKGLLKDNTLVNFREIFQSNAIDTKDIHYGSRIVFDRDGHLFMRIGERGRREKAQDLKFHNGSIVRLDKEGKALKGNPFYNQKDALPEIWSYGHRNPQGIDVHPTTGEIWSCEFGPRGGDEVNLIKAGANYGWPVITYGKEYWGPKIGETHKKGMEQPIVNYTPSISPSGMSFYSGDIFPKWKGNLFLAALGDTHLHRIVLEGKKVIKQERLLDDLDERIRQVRQGPEGYLYFSTDSGKIMRLLPK